MAAAASLTSFDSEDSFLRRVSKQIARFRNGVVHWTIFNAGQETLSFTYQNETLQDDEGLDAYHRASALQSGDLPGICKVTYSDLTERLEPPLSPWHDIDHNDPRYGHLHCSTEHPVDQDHCKKLAYLATQHEIVRPFVRSKNRIR